MSTVLDMLETVARRLEELIDDVVFVGGATTSLLVTDAAVIEIRPTIDIDLIVDITSLPKYAGLEKRLRRKGFTNVVEPDAPICRWRVEGILVDVMPSLPDILGFSNRWYKSAIAERCPWVLPSGLIIQLVRPEHFIATKIEAFLGRGNGDFLLSHDIEDMITVIDGRPELAEEISNTGESIRSFIGSHFAEFLNRDEFRTAILGYLPRDPVGQQRFQTIVDRIVAMTTQDT